MKSAPIDDVAGATTDRLLFTVTCPHCGAVPTVLTATRYEEDGTGKAFKAILRCTAKKCRRHSELLVHLARTDIVEPRDSGSEQRKKRHDD